jgi:hypothetical protein
MSNGYRAFSVATQCMVPPVRGVDARDAMMLVTRMAAL